VIPVRYGLNFFTIFIPNAVFDGLASQGEVCSVEAVSQPLALSGQTASGVRCAEME
jgi:hypothetical protein